MKNRKINSINVIFAGDGEVSVEEIEKIPQIKEYMFHESIESITDAVKNNKNVATLFEINKSGIFLELNKDQWSSALNEARIHYEKKEEFERCLLITNLLSNSTQPKNEGNRQNKRGSRQNSKLKNESKKKETNQKS